MDKMIKEPAREYNLSVSSWYDETHTETTLPATKMQDATVLGYGVLDRRSGKKILKMLR